MFDKDYSSDSDTYYNSIITSCIKATSQYILRTSMPMIAGWNDHVKPYKEQSVFWHIIWQDNGCPRHGIIYDIKRRTQAKYSRVIKTTTRDQVILKSDKMAYALQCRDKRDVRNEMIDVTCSISLTAPKVIMKFVQYLEIKTMICITVYLTKVKI